MLKTIDRAALQILRSEIDAALAAIGEKHGITLRATSGSYAGSYGHFKLEIAMQAKEGEIGGPGAEAFKQIAYQFCMKAEDLGREFTVRGETFQIIGAKPRASKMPIQIKRKSDGAVLKCAPTFCEGVFDPSASYAAIWK